MARVALLEKNEVDPIMGNLYQKSIDNGFEVLNLYKALAHSPKVGRDFLRLGAAVLGKSRLDPRLRELAILRVGNLAGATYEWTQHVPIALSCGVTEQQIENLHDWTGSDCFDERERAVLGYTDEVAEKIKASEEAFAGVRSFLDEQEVVELTVTIGYYGMVSRVLETLEIELEDKFRK